jgi:alpha-beta hydrolase superfamily lysophospholipase
MQKNNFICKENTIQSSGSEKLHLRCITNEKAVGSVVIVHGVGEHQGRYQYLEQFFLSEGYNCYLYDHRGHGLSEGIRGDVKSFHDYANDLDTVYHLAKTENPMLPLYVLGHSMGSLVVLLNLILHPGKWSGVIVTGVPLKIVTPIPKWQEVLGSLFVKLIPTISIPSDIDPAYLSHDEAVIEDYKIDKLVQHKITLRWGLAFIAAVKEVTARLGEITENLLIMHGGEDKISGVKGARLLADKLGSKQAQLIVYPGLYHELHNERKLDRNKEFEAIKAWLRSQQTNAE